MNTQAQSTKKQEVATPVYVCSHCKHELPVDAFYFNRKKQCYDNYCKECRKLSSRKQRKNDTCLQLMTEKCHYPVITQIGDTQIRMLLIQQALQKVRESVAEKRKKQHEQEFKDFE